MGITSWPRRSAALIPVLAVGLMLTGCTRYPTVSSPESLHLVAALRTACSSQRADRLTKVERAVDNAAQRGRLTEPEQTSFRQIIGQARQGDWQGAERACLAFQQAQVR